MFVRAKRRFKDGEAPELGCEVVRIQVKALSLHRPRQWGACWLALTLWDRLELDRFWRTRLVPSRQGTRWLDVLKTLVCYQLIDPGSEWRIVGWVASRHNPAPRGTSGRTSKSDRPCPPRHP